MVNCCGVPEQVGVPLAKVGVTIIVAVTGKAVLFVALKAAIFPEPLTDKPMLVRLFVQLKVVVPPVFVVLKFIVLVCTPLQTVWFEIVLTCPFGFTVIVNILGVPKQVTTPLIYEGVTVMVAITGVEPEFKALKAAIFPEPLPANPIEGVSFNQLYITVPTPVFVVVKLIAVIEVEWQTTWLEIVLTCGTGFTVILKICVGPGQLNEAFENVGVTTKLPTARLLLLLLPIKVGISPLPVNPIPILELVFVQE